MSGLPFESIAIASSETSRTTNPVTQHHIPEDSKPHPHLCENPKSRKSRSNFVTNASYFRKSIAILKVPRLRPLFLQITVILRWRSVWSIGGMVLREENRSTGRKTCTSATSYTTNPTLTGFESNRPSYSTTACSLIFSLITIIIIIINRIVLYVKVIAVCSIFISCGRNTKSV